jgi:hypothetical protein
MRYFFHAAGDAEAYEDEDGEVFAQDDDALAHAAVIARELAEDGSLDGFSIQVVDETGKEIARVPISSGRSTP